MTTAKPSVQALLIQLDGLEAWCKQYLNNYPRNSGEYDTAVTDFYKPLRDGIVFYSNGWGWRLRKNWREAIANKRTGLQDDLKRFDELMKSK
jgi:hypothetical protein